MMNLGEVGIGYRRTFIFIAVLINLGFIDTGITFLNL